MNSQTQAITIDQKTAASLSRDLGRIASSLSRASEKLARLSAESKIALIEVNRSTDPDMFTDNFIKTVRKSRKDFKQKNYTDYEKFRKTLEI